jgi:hypothetical protein
MPPQPVSAAVSAAERSRNAAAARFGSCVHGSVIAITRCRRSLFVQRVPHPGAE